jgi:CRP/FNR family transcriptional regulator, cyclic AMP receptor protein
MRAREADAIAAGERRVLVFGAGASIYRRDEIGDCAYIIRRGAVAISERGRAVETVRPGEIFGEAALINGGPRTASAVALSELELIPITRPLFALLMRDDPDFARMMIHLIARRVRATMNLLEREDGPPGRATVGGARATA